jgi:hypothetical protein
MGSTVPLASWLFHKARKKTESVEADKDHPVRLIFSLHCIPKIIPQTRQKFALVHATWIFRRDNANTGAAHFGAYNSKPFSRNVFSFSALVCVSYGISRREMEVH